MRPLPQTFKLKLHLPIPNAIRKIARKISERLPQSGWRKTAVVNTILVGLLAALLTAFSIATATISGSINGNLVFWSGSCSSAMRLNITLHLLLNIVSTAILSSSNFFMQVLASPSRAEVDAAHATKSWIDIGVPSVRNLRYLSRFKVSLWFMLVLSSVPIHLVFNSAIFEANYATGHYSMTLASEAFAHGGAYYPPGASLFNDVSDHPGIWTEWNESSDISHAIRSTAADGATWTRINADTCKEYMSRCKPLSTYRDIIVVLTSPNTNGFSAGGWIPGDLYNMTTNFNLTYALNLAGTQDCTGVRDDSYIGKQYFVPAILDIPNGAGNYGSFWARHMPLDKPNSLWYRTNCWKFSGRWGGCSQNCPDGFRNSGGLADVVNVASQQIPPLDDFKFKLGGWLQPPPWNQSMPDSTWPTHVSYVDYINESRCDQTTYDLNYLHPNIDVSIDYCLAEPFDGACMIGASVPFLFTISVCVCIKTLIAIIVVRRLRGPVLVTPGDAIESFIRYPDEATAGRVTLGQPNMGLEILQLVRRLESWRFNPEAVYLESVLRQPRPWRKTGWSGFRSVRRSVWLSSYIVVSGAFGTALVLFFIALGSFRWSLSNSIRPVGEDNESSLSTSVPVLASIIIVNSPQLLLTLGYFAYNNMFTRLAMAREWFSYASSAQPLRVTDPHGEQVSTYRLQLPYGYSIPLLVLSTGLHWMVSNTFYITIVYGDYFVYLIRATDFTVQGLPANSNGEELKLQLEYSTLAFLIVIIIGAIIVPIPLLMSLKKIKDSNMVGFPSNSHVMSAACHVSTFAAFPRRGSKRPILDTAMKKSKTLKTAMLNYGQVAAIGLMPGPDTLDMAATEVCNKGSKPAESTTQDLLSLLRGFTCKIRTRPSKRAVFAETTAGEQTGPQDVGDQAIELSATGANAGTDDPDISPIREEQGNSDSSDDLDSPLTDLDSETEQTGQSNAETSLLRRECSDRRRISRSKLKWGEVAMPQSFHERWADFGEPVGHLSFGTVSQWLGAPAEGRMYI